jgi:hypothetical protein
MIIPLADAEPVAELLQRRWFAAAAAAKSLEAECEVLLEVLEISREAWRVARAQLAKLETLRDTLGEQLAAAYESSTAPADAALSYGAELPNDPAVRREEMSAA